jgi:uncharacterized protein YkwD
MPMSVRGILVTFVAVFLPALLASPSPGAQQAATNCAGAYARPNQTSLKDARAAVRCLLNEERASRGLAPLARSKALTKAASKQSRSMVRHRYFAHQRPGGPDFAERIRRSGYAAGAGGFEAAENIAWGAGARSTPAAIVASWMGSSDHRHNILHRRFEQVGVGIARGAPNGNRSRSGGGRLADAMVVTTDFGARL